MKTLELITADQCEITIILREEITQIEGNASAIDEETDREAERWIIDQLNSGNLWAWCAVEVRATFAGLSASDYVGCCSYLSEADFRAGGYYDDMVAEAVARLNEQLEQSGEH